MDKITLVLRRAYRGSNYTIGHLYLLTQESGLERLRMPLNGVLKPIDTLEDKDRGLKDNMTEESISRIKVKNETAIPSGTYHIRTDIKSPKFEAKQYYSKLCGKVGCHVPRLEKVKGFDGVLVHCGNTIDDTSGCILVGRNTVKGQVTDSRAAFEYLMETWFSKFDVTLIVE